MLLSFTFFARAFKDGFTSFSFGRPFSEILFDVFLPPDFECFGP